MALTINQTPATCSLAQSPIIFVVNETNPFAFTSQSFQYYGDLYYWTGTPFGSGSTIDYTIVKYPNSANVGIFDLNRILNSTLTDLAQANPSNVVYYAVDFYYEFLTGSTFVTSSHVKSQTYKALDGYQIFPESIGAQINTLSPYWPMMTDGPVSQSVFSTNYGTMGAFVGSGAGSSPTSIRYVSSTGQTVSYFLSSSTATNGQIDDFPIGPLNSGFPLTGTYDWFKIQPFSSSTALGSPIHFDIVCNEKYPNIRIKWKNRFGQFDWLNFNLVSRNSFETEKRVYQPQLGTWESSTFSYNSYDSAVLNYINDSKLGISVNSNYLPESYNDILKQLLVSDEIYWLYDEPNGLVRPLTIQTSNVVFKTGVVDKLIQYQFDFKYGQPYKLIM